ncbi:uncharacterized protein FOMMEDRAFT_121479 [Fomitiporia mediterranea MF3/22]|uniref:uncharacterized protein n=1 Tax=Fomitiporia mediterranea (strain MF3/22) TaxID=694068 RepID=UPI000440975F|nr:uncharacterized protein FOMMEDRAFT_121479 [Fomitiporia mediterranea MF3/22]EJD04020.1 hypothetical protein FOMMEDRAFT_121479 [Fomitiporia mediterranea MF3/22]
MLQNPKEALADSALTLNAPAQPMASSPRAPYANVLCEGWLLKKRRKKLQGYARRYFVLSSSGVLSYSFEPGSITRDQISVPSAAISSSPRRRDIHVDSSRVTFHMKCLNKDDFDLWMGALRKFTPTGSEMEKVLTRRSLSRGISLGHQTGKFQHATIVLDEMGRTIDDISRKCYPTEEDEQGSVKSSDKGRTSNVRPKEDKAHPLLSIFKKPGNSSTGSRSKPSSARDGLPSSVSSTHIPEELAPLLSRLREQHGVLSDLLQGMSPVLVHRRMPFQETINEEGAPTPGARNASSWSSYRSSMSTVTDSGSVFFDALDADEFGAEEYVVQEDQVEEERDSAKGAPSMDTKSSVQEYEDECTDVQAEDDTPYESPGLLIDRRTRLPARPPTDEGSLFTILKKNVGQDLSNISFPCSFNEPLTLLERTAEELEYYELLNNAASTSDWVERICYVAAFAVSGYACTRFRSGRKGFTPLLGETFEEARFNFVAEKVVHKPLVIAYHADGQGWELNATSSGKTKFWGKSFEIIPTGITKLRIGADTFEWNKPSSFTRNLMMGTKYLEHCGEMIIKNTTTGAQCKLDFKETGYWASTPNVVTGIVYSPDGKSVSRLEGKWDEQLAQKLDSQHLKVLWRVTPFPRDATVYYGFTYFGISLNEITPDIKDKLPCTDSRFRPDVRSLEEGDIDGAEREKSRVEQLQRERRQRGQDPKPRWFRQIDGSEEWVYGGGYWEARRAGWKDMDIKPLW